MATVSMDGHVVLDDRGVAWIEGGNVKVVEIVLDKLAYGWNVDEIHRQHPTLSLSQIHAAFAYYYDHQHELDAEIDRATASTKPFARSRPTRPACANSARSATSHERGPLDGRSCANGNLRGTAAPRHGRADAQEDGADRLPDPKLLDRSTASGRVLVSQDSDLILESVRRQRCDKYFTGLVYFHQLGITIGRSVADLELLARVYDADDMANRIEFLPLR